MISVQLNLHQKLNRVHAELRCTKLNSDQLIPFSWSVGQAQWRHSQTQCLRNNQLPTGRNLFRF